jgi:hypothetical protein
MGGWLNDEWRRMWKEGVVAYFKVLTHYLPGGTEDYDNRKLISDIGWKPL